MLKRWWRRRRWRHSPAFQRVVERETLHYLEIYGALAAVRIADRLRSRRLRTSEKWVLREALKRLAAADAQMRRAAAFAPPDHHDGGTRVLAE